MRKYFENQEKKKKEIWLSLGTKSSTQTEKSKKQRKQHKNATKTSVEKQERKRVGHGQQLYEISFRYLDKNFGYVCTMSFILERWHMVRSRSWYIRGTWATIVWNDVHIGNKMLWSGQDTNRRRERETDKQEYSNIPFQNMFVGYNNPA